MSQTRSAEKTAMWQLYGAFGKFNEQHERRSFVNSQKSIQKTSLFDFEINLSWQGPRSFPGIKITHYWIISEYKSASSCVKPASLLITVYTVDNSEAGCAWGTDSVQYWIKIESLAGTRRDAVLLCTPIRSLNVHYLMINLWKIAAWFYLPHFTWRCNFSPAVKFSFRTN